jgi:hypothetical protein
MSEAAGAKIMRKFVMIIAKLTAVKDIMLAGLAIHSTCIQPFPCMKTTNSLLSHVPFCGEACRNLKLIIMPFHCQFT